jgi:predicted Zn-dependent protease with MMP-like domain
MENDEDGDPPRLEMSALEFEALAREVVSELPQEFQDHIAEIIFSVEPYAPDDLLEQMEVPEDEDLFGLYEGAALTERSLSDAPLLPPRIRLFYEAILDDCFTLEDVREEVRTTLLHEIGHHFGMDEEELERLGYG